MEEDERGREPGERDQRGGLREHGARGQQPDERKASRARPLGPDRGARRGHHRRNRHVRHPCQGVGRDDGGGEDGQQRQRSERRAGVGVGGQPSRKEPDRDDEHHCVREREQPSDPLAVVEYPPRETLLDVEERSLEKRRGHVEPEPATLGDLSRPRAEGERVPQPVRHDERREDRRDREERGDSECAAAEHGDDPAGKGHRRPTIATAPVAPIAAARVEAPRADTLEHPPQKTPKHPQGHSRVPTETLSRK